MSYTETLHELGQETERQVLALWRLVPDELSPADFDELAAVIVATASAQGAALAELSLVVAVADELGPAAAAPAAAAPSLHHVNTERLARAFATARESSTGDPIARLARLARAEPVESSQRAYSRAIAGHPAATGWVRQLDADPCQLCRWWERGGRVWPSSHTMPTHTGCECHPRVVLSRNIRPVSR